MRNRPAYVLPDVLPGAAAHGGMHLYAHAARLQDARCMISFTTYALSVVLSGRKRLQHGMSSEEFGAGQAVLFRPGHCLSTDMSAGGQDYRSMLLFFTQSYISGFIHRHRLNALPSDAGARSHIPFPAPAALQYQAESLWRAPDTHSLSAARTAAKLEDVLLLLLESQGAALFGFFAAPAVGAPHARLKQVVESHWTEDLSWQEIAFLCHMSLSTFKRHFQAVYGCPPSQWLHERRLHLAAHLLKVERRRASDIYLDIGFSTASAFTQSFKSFFGVTPKVYQDSAA